MFKEYFEKADIIFHDCETAEKQTGAHAHYNDLAKFDPKIKGKMWLYDYNDGPLPDAIKDGFQGFIVKGQAFEF